jgi:hypothetical protein
LAAEIRFPTWVDCGFDLAAARFAISDLGGLWLYSAAARRGAEPAATCVPAAPRLFHLLLLNLDAAQAVHQLQDPHYRSHYPGALSRAIAFLKWLKFKALDFVWGNGENLSRLIRFVLIVLLSIALCDVVVHGDPGRVQSYFASFVRSFAIFFGTLTPDDYGKVYLALITLVRLITVGFFLSIIIKRFSRR